MDKIFARIVHFFKSNYHWTKPTDLQENALMAGYPIKMKCAFCPDVTNLRYDKAKNIAVMWKDGEADRYEYK